MTVAEYTLAPLANACGCRESFQRCGDAGEQLIRYTRMLATQGEFDYAHEEGDEGEMNETTKRVWEFSSQYIRSKHGAPTLREIGAACGISSTSVVSYHLGKLAQAGIISKREPKTARMWRVLKQPKARAG